MFVLELTIYMYIPADSSTRIQDDLKLGASDSHGNRCYLDQNTSGSLVLEQPYSQYKIARYMVDYLLNSFRETRAGKFLVGVNCISH